MMWLWAVGPLVVGIAAVWLGVMTRRLARVADELVDQRQITIAERRASLHRSLAGLHDDIVSYGRDPSADSDAGTVGR